MSTPTLTAFLPKTTPDTVWNALLRIPGIRRRGPQILVPHHAVPHADHLIHLGGITACNPSWQPPPPTPVTWSDVESRLLEQGEFKPVFLGDYPLPHQRQGVAAAAPLTGFILHHPVGSGKTLEALAWALYEDGPVVIVTRTATCTQFVREIHRHTTVIAFALKSATNVRKRDRFQSLDAYLEWCDAKDNRPIVVVGYESLHLQAEKLIAKVHPVSLVVDECHLLRSKKRWLVSPIPSVPRMPENPSEEDIDRYEEAVALRNEIIADGKSTGGFIKDNEMTGEEVIIVPADNRSMWALRLAKASRRRLLTSATLIVDRVRDLYGQLSLAEPEAWGSWTTWSNRHCDARPHKFNAMARDTTGQSNVEELTSRMQMILHTVSAVEVRKAMPPLRRETLYVERDQMCELTEAEAKRFAREAGKAAKRGKSALVEVQIADAAARCRKAILDRVEDHVLAGQKVVIFTVRKWLVKALEGNVRGRVRKKGKVWAATGDDPQNVRRDILDEFVAHEGGCVLVGTGYAWGTSVDGLQCAHALFLVGFPYTPGELDQWEGRLIRLGGVPTIIYYVVGEGTVLEALASIVLDKLPAVEQVADTGALAGVDAILGGTADPEALAASILAKIGVEVT